MNKYLLLIFFFIPVSGYSACMGPFCYDDTGAYVNGTLNVGTVKYSNGSLQTATLTPNVTFYSMANGPADADYVSGTYGFGGGNGGSVTLSASSTSSVICLKFTGFGSHQTTGSVQMTFFKDSTNLATVLSPVASQSTTLWEAPASTGNSTIAISACYVPGDTSSHRYTFQGKTAGDYLVGAGDIITFLVYEVH